MSKKLIGICGSIGSGKDTAAQYLIDAHGYVRISFADTLKDAAAGVFGWDREMLEGKTSESRKERERIDNFWSNALGRDWSPRIALQYLGTELFRNNLHPNIWVIAAEKRIIDKVAKGTASKFVISDVRFPNEITMIRRLGGEVWRIRRGEDPLWLTDIYKMGKDWALKNMPQHHPSEWEWIWADFDFTLDNDATLDLLYNKIENYVSKK